MADIVINPAVGKIEFFSVKGDNVTNTLRLSGNTLLVTGPLSASSISTGGGGAFVTSVQPTANYLSKFTGNSTIANSLVYDNGTNVGIGTTSPTTKLAVSDGTTIAQVNPASGVAYFGTVNNYPMALSVNSSEKVRIFSGGAVSFGTSTDTLSAAGNIYLNGATGTAAGPVIAFGQSDSVTGGVGHRARIVGAGTSQDIFIQSQGASNSIGLNANPSGAVIYFETQGVEKARITAAGNLGIGTTSPGYKLHVNGNGYFNNTLVVNSDLSLTGGGDVLIYDSDGTGFFASYMDSGVAYMRVDDGGSANGSLYINSKFFVGPSTGNVGIGTSSPGGILDIQSSNAGDQLVRTWNTNTAGTGKAILRVANSGNNAQGTQLQFTDLNYFVGTIASDRTNGMAFYVGQQATALVSERMRITSTGCVGIGTTSVRSNSLLDVYGAGVFGTSAYGFYVGTDATGAFLDAGTQLMRMFAGQQERMRIATDGNVGIGTTTTAAKLHINSTTAGATLLRTDGTSGTLFSVVDDLSDSLMSVNNSAGLPVLEVFADDRIVGGQYGQNDFVVVNNKVGIGTNNPIGKLHVTGSSSVPAAILMGNVGIGTTSFTYSNTNRGDLEIYGSADALISLRNATANSYLQKTGNDFYFNNGGAGFISITTNASERMRIASDGNVGIGTTSPTGTYGKLSVAGGIHILGDNNAKLEIGRYSSGASNSYIKLGSNSNSLRIANNTDAADIFTIENGGNVGIGTTTPAYKLEVATGTSGQQSLANFRTADTTAANNAGIQIFATPSSTATSRSAILVWDADGANGSGGDYFFIQKLGNSGQVDLNQQSNAAMTFQTNGTERMRITSAGNVGIGTTSPTATLQVGSNSVSIVSDNSVIARIGGSSAGARVFNLTLANTATATTSNESALSFIVAGTYSATSIISAVLSNIASAGTDLVFTTYNNSLIERMRIRYDGNVGIGTTAPGYKLDVNGIIAVSSSPFADKSGNYNRIYEPAGNVAIYLGNASDPANYYDNTTHYFRNRGGSSNYVIINSSGNLGIGTSTVGAPLTIYRASNPWMRINGGGAFSYIQMDDGTSYGYLFKNTSSDTTNGALAGAMYTYTDSNKAFQHIHSGTPLFTILSGGSVGIGTTGPITKLDVRNGYITAGTGVSTSGTTIIGGYYSDGNLTILGTEYSSGGPMLGYGVTPSTTSAGAFLSSTGINVYRSAYVQDGGTHRWFTGTVQTVAVGSAVSMSEKMRMDTNGNVGIGTTTGTFTLNVYNNADVWHAKFGSATGELRIGGQTNNGAVIQAFVPGSGTVRDLYLQRDGGNVGIGTSSPGYKLDVNGIIGLSGLPFASYSSNYNRIFEPAGNVAIYLGNATDPGNYYDNTTHSIRNRGGGSTYVTINSSGNVGIGTTSPGAKLQTYATNTGAQFLMSGQDGVNSLNFGLGFSVNSQTFATIAGYYTDSGGSGAGDLTFYTKTTSTSLSEKMRIQANGNVGIGTTNPVGKLDVRAGSGGEIIFGSYDANYVVKIQSGDQLNFYNGASAGAGYINYGGGATVLSQNLHVEKATGATTGLVRINSNGNVGIGTTSVTSKLQIIAPDSPGIGILSNNAGQYVYQYIGRTASELEFGIAGASGHFFTGTVAGDAIIKQNSTGKIHLGYGSGAPSITINSSNNVGIGTTSPANKLEVKGVDDAAITAIFQSTAGGNAAYNGGIQLGNAASSQNSQIYHNSSGDNTLTFVSNYGSGTGNKFIFAPGGTERVRFQQNGNVGIGTTSPAQKLHVVGAVYGTTYGQFGTAVANGANASFAVFGGNSTSVGVKLVLDSDVNRNDLVVTATSGNIGIGTNSAGSKLDVVGTIRLSSNLLSHKVASYTTSYPGINSFGADTTDSSLTYYDTGKLVANTAFRGVVWTGKHYIFTDYTNNRAYFYDNNFVQIPNAYGYFFVTLPLPSGYANPHGAAWDGRYLWCVVYTGAASKIVGYDLDTTNQTATIIAESAAITAVPYTYDIEYADGHLYLVYVGTLYIYKWNGSSIDFVSSYAGAAGGISAQAITYDGSYLWVTSNGQNIYKVGLDGTPLATITTITPNVCGWAWNGSNIVTFDYANRNIFIINTTRLRIDTQKLALMGGNVGIGTISPGALLNIRASVPTGTGGVTTGTNLLIDSNTNNYITFRNTSDNGTYAGLVFLDNNVGGYIAFGNSGAAVGSDSMIYGSYNDHIFQNGYVNETLYNRTETMRIKQNGYVGINTNNPTGRLHVVQGNSGGVAAILLSSDESTIQGPSANTQIRMGSNLVLAASNVMPFNVNGSEKMRIQSDGNVGIGTTSPADKLHVIGNIRINGGDILNWGGQAFIQTIGANDMFFRPNSTLRMILTAGGNLGIGNGFINPLAKLHINSTTSGETLLRADGTSGTLFSVVDDLSDSLMSVNNSAGLPVLEVFADDRVVAGQYGKNDLVVINNKVGIGTNNPVAKLHVTGSTSIPAAVLLGDVGIGTTAPTAQSNYRFLQVNGPVSAIIETMVGGTRIGGFDSTSNTLYVGTIGSFPIVFRTAVDEKMRILANGNVGIGVTAPTNKLEVSTGADDTVGVRVRDSINGAWTEIRRRSIDCQGGDFWINGQAGSLDLRTGNTSRVYISSTGNVGIGSTAPTQKLDVAGSIYTSAKLVQKSTTQSLSGTTGCTIDLANGVVHILSLANGTVISSFTYSSRDNNPSVNTLMLVFKYAGTASATFTNVIWANGVAPTLTGTSGYADVFMLTSYQGGAGTPVWIGTVVSQGLVSTNL